jgi:hypothetical protein
MKQCMLLTHEFVNGEILCKSSVLYPIFGPVYIFLCITLSIVFHYPNDTRRGCFVHIALIRELAVGYNLQT